MTASFGPIDQKTSFEHLLKWMLAQIVACDNDYDYRYQLVLDAMSMAGKVGLKAGFRVDPQEPEWPVAYIELPTGQVSWHMPQHETPWDGHTTEEKFERIRRWVES